VSLAISSAFDAGNIVVRSIADPLNVQLEIRRDVGDEHLQWFYFRVSGACDQPLRLRLTNAGSSSYPRGWENYRACMSLDREDWTRVSTRYQNGELIIEDTPTSDIVYYAYFAPYPLERHHDLIAKCAQHPLVRAERLGETPDGRDLDLLRIGDTDAAKKPCWIIARQHPGETMAEWFVEGLLSRLLDAEDSIAQELLRQATFYVVPNMNPDGSVRGHLRCNALGMNLNREWLQPSLERSPEVYLVRERMLQTGVKFALDVHGDEALPYNFIAGADGVASLAGSVHAARRQYKETLQRVCPDFQTEFGYPVVAPGKANLQIATNWIAEKFGALSMTLEQPFKDTANAPHPHGWSPGRAQILGRANLDALAVVLPTL
jgi:murein tripeptide amidase MpaA